MASIVKGRRDELKGENLRRSSVNGVDIYMIASQQRSVPTWVSKKNQSTTRKRKQKDGEKVALLQDLWFDTSTSRIKSTPDGEYLIASGVYPPQIKIYELSQLSMKCERHLTSEIVDFKILSDDYSKMAFLCADRSISLHAKYGWHYTLRIPRMGRAIEYDYWSCDLLCAASSPELYRLNLEQGRFLSSLTTQSPGLNAVSRSKVHGLIACGGDDGAVECFDTRAKTSVGRINAVAAVGDFDTEVTALEFDGDTDYQMAVGTSSGKILLYDLRSSNPIRVKDHMYDNPILNIKWHRTINSAQPKLIATDNRIVRIWNPETGEGMTSIEPSGGKINDMCIFPGTGLILLALESRQIPAYFIPELGPAPKWSPRLQLWEELELDADIEGVVYDNFRYLTAEDLERLNLTNLIGTNLLRAYMHGYLIDYRLYKKAKELSNPFSLVEYMEKRKQEKMDKEHANRITTKKKLPAVNRNLAKRILDNEEAENDKGDEDDKEESKKASKKKKNMPSRDILKDERFAQMFEDEEFEIDEDSKEYLALHPVASTNKQPSMVNEHFEPVSDEASSEASLSEASDDELDNQAQNRARPPRLYEIKDERHAEAFSNRVSLAKEDALAMGERVSALGNNKRSAAFSDIKFGPGGSREISFKSRSSAKYREDDGGDGDGEPRREKRRGVQSLGLKSDRNSSFGGGRGRGGLFGGRGRGGRRGGRGRGGGRR